MKFSELLEQEGIPFVSGRDHSHSREGWINIDCPWCGSSSSKFHLGYPIGGKVCHCWKCGLHSLTSTVMQLFGIGYQDAKKILDGIEFERFTKLKRTGTLELPEELNPNILQPHSDYLKERRFKPDEIKKVWRIQSIGWPSQYAWRIFIPIHFENQLVSWTTRSIDPDCKQRYMSASEKQEIYNHKELLYGEEYCGKSICCVEGPISAWAIGPGTVATCGTGFTMSQVRRLSNFPERFICFDPEPIAQRRAKALQNMLAVFPGKTWNLILDSGDPADCLKSKYGRTELNHIRKLLQ